MAYIALRFDLRFAPGAVVAMIHDSVVLIGILVIIQRLTGKLELNINSVAAVLTVVGYSVNDTVIVYDRLRENLGVRRGVPFLDLINISVSEMLGRTLIASGTSLMSLLAFFLWGTGTLREFAITLTVGIVLGTYSSIYVALPFTYWFDRQFFAKLAAKQPRRTVTRKAGATV